MIHSEKNGFEASKLLVQHFMQNSIQKQVKVAEQDYMLQFLNKLKPYTKFVPEKVH